MTKSNESNQPELEHHSSGSALNCLVMPDCNHEFTKKPNIKCSRNKGHNGAHRFYEETSNRGFTIHEWNDNGETPMQQEEHGVAFPCNYNGGHSKRQKTMNLAVFDAKKTVPKGTVFEVRAKVLPKDCLQDYCRVKRTIDEIAKDWGIAWYFVPNIKQPDGLEECGQPPTATEPLFQNDVDEGEFQEFGGYILLARIEA